MWVLIMGMTGISINLRPTTDCFLSIFVACQAGNPDLLHGNIIDVIGDKSGHCAMGWTKDLNLERMKYYGWEFWRLIPAKTIQRAHIAARDNVKNSQECIALHAAHPDQYNEYCNMDSLYCRENNHGCHSSLPSGSGSSEFSPVDDQKKESTIPPSSRNLAKAVEAIQNFTDGTVTDAHFVEVSDEGYADLYRYETTNTTYIFNDRTGRVQSATWFEDSSVDHGQAVVNLEQGYTIAEQFAREKYPKFWTVSDSRYVKNVTKNVLETGCFANELQYEWWEYYHTPEAEIPGLNTVSVSVNPYTGEITSYFESYSPSVLTGTPPVNLTPFISENTAKKIAEDYFRSLGVEEGPQTALTSLGLRVSEENRIPHLEWNFGMTRTYVAGSGDNEWEYTETALVSIDAHDGTIVWTAPFG
jgi:hypothetical protein